MLDRTARRLVDPPLERLAAICAEHRIGATTVTLIGFGVGLVAMILVANQFYVPALLALAINRIADGLDGALARGPGPPILAATSISSWISSSMRASC